MIRDLDNRIEMCRSVREGCELEDCIRMLCDVVQELEYGDDEGEAEHILVSAENICKRYLTWALEEDLTMSYEEYLEQKEVIKHFLNKEFEQSHFESTEPEGEGI